MPKDIISLTQNAEDSDRVMSAWVNAVNQKTTDLEQRLAYANQQIAELQAQISQAFKITPTAGLTANVAGESIKIGGAVQVIPSTSLNFPDNATTYVFINDAGTLQTANTRPATGYEVGYVVTGGGSITQAINYPLFEVKPAAIDLTQYATRDYADSRRQILVAKATKAIAYSIPATGQYYTIPMETLTGVGWNTGGEFTHSITEAVDYILKAQVRIDTLAVASNPDMAAKISLFVFNSRTGLEEEINTALAQGESARGDLVLNAQNAEPVTLQQNDKAMIKVYLTVGTLCRVRENSVISVWRLP